MRDRDWAAAQYRAHLERRGLRPASVRRIGDAVDAWCASVPGWPRTTGLELQRWIEERRWHGRPLSTRSRYWWLSTLHRFYTWAVREQLAPADPTLALDRPRLPQLHARPIGEVDVD